MPFGSGSYARAQYAGLSSSALRASISDVGNGTDTVVRGLTQARAVADSTSGTDTLVRSPFAPSRRTIDFANYRNLLTANEASFETSVADWIGGDVHSTLSYANVGFDGAHALAVKVA